MKSKATKKTNRAPTRKTHKGQQNPPSQNKEQEPDHTARCCSSFQFKMPIFIGQIIFATFLLKHISRASAYSLQCRANGPITPLRNLHWPDFFRPNVSVPNFNVFPTSLLLSTNDRNVHVSVVNVLWNIDKATDALSGKKVVNDKHALSWDGDVQVKGPTSAPIHACHVIANDGRVHETIRRKEVIYGYENWDTE